MASFLSYLLALLLAPLFPGLILKVKAWFAGRQGPPLFICYFTLKKLLGKGVVYSTSTTFIFRLAPQVALATSLMLLLFFPLAGTPPCLWFHGDVLFLFYLMGLARFFTILAALDTASPFEGMGAAREAFFATLAEACVFAVLILFFRLTGAFSFAEFFAPGHSLTLASNHGPLLILVVVALYIVMLTENSRLPVDDPATHLELTMIHEVMILDHSGPDLAFIELASWLKLLFYSSLLARIITPLPWANPWLNGLLFYGVIGGLTISIGVVESITARYRFRVVPKFILMPFVLVFFAIILTMEVMK